PSRAAHRIRPSFPTRRSSDLSPAVFPHFGTAVCGRCPQICRYRTAISYFRAGLSNFRAEVNDNGAVARSLRTGILRYYFEEVSFQVAPNYFWIGVPYFLPEAVKWGCNQFITGLKYNRSSMEEH